MMVIIQAQFETLKSPQGDLAYCSFERGFHKNYFAVKAINLCQAT